MRAVTVDQPDPDQRDDTGRPLRPTPDHLRIIELDDPTPGRGEVLIDVIAAGINRADLLQRQGLYPPPPGVSDIIGLEVSGTVAALGANVSGLEMGQTVVALLAGGGYAERVVVPAGQVIAAPNGIDAITAATLVEVAATVVSNADAVHLSDGETLLVHGGSGGIGSFAIQYGKTLGCTVAATAGTEAKREYCSDLGADIVLDHHSDWVAELRQATNGRGADVVLDIIGAKYLSPNIDALAPDGRIIVIGMQGGAKGELDLGRLMAKRGTLTATGLRFRPIEQKAAICQRVAEQVWPLYASGAIVPAPVEQFALDDVAAAHQRLESGDSMGKLALVM